MARAYMLLVNESVLSVIFYNYQSCSLSLLIVSAS
uniref:Uncharacterized protein n=1 Tax=Anguilla anguilla TaxID=7936 RepID=A0A0E9R2Z8_ANGAN